MAIGPGFVSSRMTNAASERFGDNTISTSTESAQPAYSPVSCRQGSRYPCSAGLTSSVAKSTPVNLHSPYCDCVLPFQCRITRLPTPDFLTTWSLWVMGSSGCGFSTSVRTRDICCNPHHHIDRHFKDDSSEKVVRRVPWLRSLKMHLCNATGCLR